MRTRQAIVAFGVSLPLWAAAETLTWDELLDRSDASLREAQRVLLEEHRAADYARYEIDGLRSELTLSGGSQPGLVGLVGRVAYVGSFSPGTRTWLWGWADRSVPSHLSAPLRVVRALGRQHGFTTLTRRQWQGELGEAQDMAAIAHHLLDGKGIYRSPANDRQMYRYWVFLDLRPLRP